MVFVGSFIVIKRKYILTVKIQLLDKKMTVCLCVYFDIFVLFITLSSSLLISLFLVTARFKQCCSFSADSEVPPEATE